MSDNDTDDGRRIKARNIDEGDRVFMGINLHGRADDVPGAGYDSEIHQAGVEGTVTEALTEREKSLLADGKRPMTDVAVETDGGHTFRWNVDNGYVIGWTSSMNRRTDVGKIGGFYRPADE